MNNEPVAASTVATVVSWVAARYALDMDANTAMAVALIVFGIGQWAARQLVTPVRRANQRIRQAALMEPGSGPAPTL